MNPDPIDRLSAESALIAVRSPVVMIADAAGFTRAVADRATIKAYLARVAEVLDPICDAAHRTWKTATGRRDALRQPALDADKALSRAMGAYEQDQERKRQVAEAYAREQARAETERLRAEDQVDREAEAAAARLRGDTAYAAEVEAAPVVLPVVRPAYVAMVQPTASGVSFRDVWSAEVTDNLILIRAVAEGTAPLIAVVPNMAMLNQAARALKDRLAIPGVRAVSERIAAQRGAW